MTNNTRYSKTNIGNIYPFVILKEITLPDDSSNIYVISDEENNKFTLPKNNYEHYGFKVGQKIQCSLDRINCSGQLFLEPVNPYYKENTTYEFEFIDFKSITNYLGFKEQIGIVKDYFGKQQWIRQAQKLHVVDNKVKATVSFIKKGKLYLVPNSTFNNLMSLRQAFDFKIMGVKNIERFGEVYILNDRDENIHVLPTKYYKHYNLKKQQWFKAIVQKFSSKGFFYIEPLHPYYKIGEIYKFNIIDKIMDVNTTTYFIEDKLGTLTNFKSSISSIELNTLVSCKVVNLKKGIPELELSTAN